jgi:hypothetical protein
VARWELLFNAFCEFGLKEAKESMMNLGKSTGGGHDKHCLYFIYRKMR